MDGGSFKSTEDRDPAASEPSGVDELLRLVAQAPLAEFEFQLEDLRGRRLGRYALQSPLGRGGMGIVYLARDEALGRDVAIKVLARISTLHGARDRFLFEARAAATIDHPNVARIYDVGDDDGILWFAMEYVHGESIRSRLRNGRVRLEGAIAIGTQVASALRAIHEHGFLHRDLKPENVMLAADGRVKVVDFGLARRIVPTKDAKDALPLTNPGQFLGTPGYASPEQASGNPVDERSDIFSFGILLCEMLSGIHPFQRDSPAKTTLALMREEPSVPSLATVSLRETICRALAKEPAARHQSAGELLEALHRAAIEVAQAHPPRADDGASPARQGHVLQTSDPLRSLVANVTALPPRAIGRSVRRNLVMTTAGVILLLVSFVLYRRTRSTSKPDVLDPRLRDQHSAESFVPSAPRSASAEAWALYCKAMLAARDASSELANELFDRATTLDPNFAAAHLGYVETALQVNEAARTHYQAALLFRALLNDEERAIVEAYAPLLGSSHDRRATAEKLAPLLEGSKDHAFLVQEVSKFRRRGGDPEGALEISERLLKRLPSLAAGWEARGQSLLELGRNDEAEASFSDCLRHAPGALGCLSTVGTIHLGAGRCQEAERTAQEIMAAAPRFDFGYSLLAFAVFPRRRSADEALAMLSHAWERTPADWRQWNELSSRINLETAQGHFREAARLAERWAALEDNASDDVTRFAAAIHGAIALYEAGDTRASDAVAVKYLSTRASALPNTGFHTGISMLGFRYHAGTIDGATFRQRRRDLLAQLDPDWLERSPTNWYTAYAGPVETPEDAKEALAMMPDALRSRAVSALTMAAVGLLGDVAHVYWVAGDVERTLQTARVVTKSCIGLYYPQAWIQAHLDLGGALESVGQKDDACKAYTVVTDWWGKAEYSRSAEKARLGMKRACGQQG